MPKGARFLVGGAFFTLLELLNSKALDRNPERARELAQSLAEQAAAQAG